LLINEKFTLDVLLMPELGAIGKWHLLTKEWVGYIAYKDMGLSNRQLFLFLKGGSHESTSGNQGKHTVASIRTPHKLIS